MKYKMIAALLNGSAEEQTKCLKDIEYFERTYPIESNVEEEFENIISDYIADYDNDGVYLFKRK